MRITALATDRVDGGRGFPARFELAYGYPGSGRMGGLFRAITVELPNVSSPDDPLGYLTQGRVVLPRTDLEAVLPPSRQLLVRIARRSAEDPHIAFNATSLRLAVLGASDAAGTESAGDVSGGAAGGFAADLPETASADEAALIEPGDHGGSLAPAAGDASDWYAVALDRGQILHLRLAVPTGLGAVLRLLTPEEARRREVGAQGGAAVLRHAAETAGTWLVQVVGTHGSGNYDLAVEVVDQDDAGLGGDGSADAAGASPLDAGAYTGELLRGDDDDWFRVALEAGDVLDVDLVSVGAARLSLQLQTPAGTVRKTIGVPAGEARALRYGIDESGEWLVRVRRLSGEGGYGLTLRQAQQDDGGTAADAPDSTDLAPALEPGPQVGQLLARDDRDIFAVPVERGDTIALGATSTTESLRIALAILGAAGQKTISESVRPFEETLLRYAATQAGTWYADLRRVAGAGPYGIEVQVLPQDDAGSGQDAGACGEAPVPLASPASNGQMLRGDAVDCFELSLAADERVSLRLLTDGRLGASLTLRTSGGRVVGGLRDAEGVSELSFARDQATEASVIVRRLQGDGPYRLEVAFDPPRGGTSEGGGESDTTGGGTAGGEGGTAGGETGGGETGGGESGGDEPGGGGGTPPIAVTVADGGRRLVSDRPFQVAPGSAEDGDADGLDQQWEDQALALAAPWLQLDEEEDWLVRRPAHKLLQLVRVTPWPSVEAPTHVFFYYVMAWTQDYGRFSTGIAEWDEHVAIRHNGDLERAILAFAITDPGTLDLAAVFTSAHGDETNHSGVWAARGQSCLEGKVKLGVDEILCDSLEFDRERLVLQVSADKHAVYPTEALCEMVQLVFRMELPLAFGETGFGEDCGGGARMVADSRNVGEPWQHLDIDVAAIFPGEAVWGGDGFCGGRGSTYESALPCVGSIENAVSTPSPLLLAWLGGARVTDPGLMEQVIDSFEGFVDLLPDLPDLPQLPGLPQIDAPDDLPPAIEDLFEDLF